MEWDYGTPWYRPTRVNHVVSGSEYGWRTGTGKWPSHYPDSLPPTIDIGPGCPTGAEFGTGANFPRRYQDALYILDWTFGTIYAVHLTPDGASYTGTRETFVAGKPFPVTDLVFHSDGAMYFAIGGRRTQSALYRVTWAGGDIAEKAPAQAGKDAAKLRKLRKRLEAFHGRRDPKAVDGGVQAPWPRGSIHPLRRPHRHREPAGRRMGNESAQRQKRRHDHHRRWSPWPEAAQPRR